MTQILIFIIGAGVGFFVAWVWFAEKQKEMKREAGRFEKEIKTEREMWYGFSEFNDQMAKIKQERKQIIMNELRKGGILSVSKVTDMLDISRATAFRYMEELQQEGLIGQEGRTGKNVTYRPK